MNFMPVDVMSISMFNLLKSTLKILTQPSTLTSNLDDCSKVIIKFKWD